MLQTGSRPPGGLRRDISIGAAILILLLVALLVLSEMRAYDETIDTGRARAQTLAELLAGESETAVRAIDVTLRGIARSVGNGGPIDAAPLFRIVNQEAREQSGVRAFLVVGPDGSLAVDSDNLRPRRLSFLGRPFFERYRGAAGDETAVDIEAGDAAAPAIVFSRRLTGPDGRFAGVALAMLDPGYFLGLFGGIGRGAMPDVLLLHADGTLLARYPQFVPQGAFGTKLPVEAVMRAEQPVSALFGGGEARIAGVSRLTRLPLAVAVALDRDRILSAWRYDALFDGGVALFGIAGMLTLLFILRGYLGQHEEDRASFAAREDEMVSANEHLVAALAHTNHGTAMFDRDRRLVLCNRRYLDLMRLGDGALRPGMSFEETVEVLRQAGTYSAVELAEMTNHRRAAFGIAEPQTYFEHLADGTILQLHSDPMREGGLLLTLTDITASVASAEALRAAKEEAERANEAKSDFIAHISHDLRTPLTAIIGFSDALSGGYFGELPAKQKEYIDTIGISAQHLLALINNLLDVAKIEAGHYELDEEQVELADLVERLIRLVQLRAEQQGIAIDNRIGETWLTADANAMQQMLLNLFSNAVKFTPGGGTITVETRPAEDGGLDLIVSDTGVGIPAEYREQVMLPYVRVSSARRVEGTGLGLPLAKALIELHGGSILLDSEPGKGTTVALRFPAARVISAACPA